MTVRNALTAAMLLCGFASYSRAHDTWVETNTAVVRVGDVVHVDLKLGNHGNDHRDFKLASKITLAPCKIGVVAPSGESTDLKSKLVDTGFGPKEGYWSARFIPTTAGPHMVVHTLDTLHGTTRAIKSAKTCFHAGTSLDTVASSKGVFDRRLGHTLELVPQFDPVVDAAAGRPVKVAVYFNGQPLAGARVTFVPRGAKLADGFDKDFERTSDAEGRAEFTPTEGNIVLVVVHHAAPDQKGEGYDKTHYSATLTVNVPELLRAGTEKATAGK
jgi:uncharacterized GH25 family protein